MNVVLTDHARERAKEMGVSTNRVKSVVNEPSLVYPALGYDNCSIAQREELAVVYATEDDTRIVITVLWHGEEGR